LTQQLDEIAREIAQGRSPLPITVRQLLQWFGHQRRGNWVVQEIRNSLENTNLVTEPDFETAWLDAEITFHARPVRTKKKPATEAVADPSADAVGAPTESILSWVARDPTYRLSKLPAANQTIVSIKPSGTLAEAATILMARNFSQLPVMTNERDVKGMLTWKTIGAHLAFNGTSAAATAQELMEAHHEISAQRSLFDAIDTIVTHQYVLVRGEDRRVTGIITASDLSLQFRTLAEPFLLLSEIENMVRSLISTHFPPSQLAEARDPAATGREVASVSDLTFGEYVRLLDHPERWSKLKLSVDRTTFCVDLDRMRRIRNDVMHFDPDGVPADDLERLREFTNFLKELQAITAKRKTPMAGSTN
jgi:predicted transcriptional regulator